MAPTAENVRVVARFRPLTNNRTRSDDLDMDDTEVRVSYGTKKTYTLDKIWESAQQTDLYDYVLKDNLPNLLKGLNMTVFAYGQTGSGKTHTMFGNPGSQEEAGLIPRACVRLFELFEEDESSVSITCSMSMMEIYKEEFKDLLDPVQKNISVFEGRDGQPIVEGMSREYASSAEGLLELIDVGLQSRVVTATNMNAQSSRSHSVIIITVESKTSEGETRKGVINLVDLAGSEKIKKTGAQGSTLEEAKKINLSLTCLSHCITSLVKGESHIPFRSSKLTRLLQNSLGGNSKTTLIVCCSMEEYNIEETVSTLNFARTAKQIKNKVSANVAHTAEYYKKQVAALEEEIFHLRAYVKKLEVEAGIPQDDEGESKTRSRLDSGGAPVPDQEIMRMRKKMSDLELVRRTSMGRTMSQPQISSPRSEDIHKMSEQLLMKHEENSVLRDKIKDAFSLLMQFEIDSGVKLSNSDAGKKLYDELKASMSMIDESDTPQSSARPSTERRSSLGKIGKKMSQMISSPRGGGGDSFAERRVAELQARNRMLLEEIELMKTDNALLQMQLAKNGDGSIGSAFSNFMNMPMRTKKQNKIAVPIVPKKKAAEGGGGGNEARGVTPSALVPRAPGEDPVPNIRTVRLRNISTTQAVQYRVVYVESAADTNPIIVSEIVASGGFKDLPALDDKRVYEVTVKGGDRKGTVPLPRPKTICQLVEVIVKAEDDSFKFGVREFKDGNATGPTPRTPKTPKIDTLALVKIVQGRNLVKMDKTMFGKEAASDPFVQIFDQNGNKLAESEHVENNCNPQWNYEVMVDPQDDRMNTLTVEIMDRDSNSKSDPMGKCVVDLSERDYEEIAADWYPLEQSEKGGKFGGDIQVFIKMPRKPKEPEPAADDAAPAEGEAPPAGEPAA